jgi:hypothetical protein
MHRRDFLALDNDGPYSIVPLVAANVCPSSADSFTSPAIKLSADPDRRNDQLRKKPKDLRQRPPRRPNRAMLLAFDVLTRSIEIGQWPSFSSGDRIVYLRAHSISDYLWLP